LALALAVVSSAVAPTYTPSTMIGPLKLADFQLRKHTFEIHFAVPNWDMTSPLGAGQLLRAKASDMLGNGSSSATGSLPV
jgi:hypothetical protein